VTSHNGVIRYAIAPYDLAKELSSRATGRTLYIWDVLHELVSQCNTVVAGEDGRWENEERGAVM
jgi:hypothetical protein